MTRAYSVIKLMNVTLLKTCVALLFALLVAAGCSPSKQEKVIILHTGRMAGNVYPMELKGLAPLQYYPYLAAYVAQVRSDAQKNGDQVLLVDSGDSLLGSFASHTTQAQNVVTLFNELHYDAIFLGNLDANLDEAMLQTLKAPVLIPFIRESSRPAMVGTHLGLKLLRGNREIILLPNFYGDTSRASAPYRFPVWFGSNPSEVGPLREYHSSLNSLAPISPEAFVLFLWMKFEVTGNVPVAFLEQLKSWGVHAILGHTIYGSTSRETWKQRDFSSWGIPVSENILRENRGFTVARLDLVRTGKGWKQEGSTQLIPLSANIAKADPLIIQKMRNFADTIRQADEVLGQLNERVNEEALLKYHLSTLGKTPRANLVFYSATSIRGSLDSGKLTASKFYNVIPWTNELSLIELNTEQLAKMRKMKGFVLLSQPDASRKPVVVSSRYFTRLLQDALGLEDSQIKVIAPNEFEFAKNMIKTSGVMPSANPQLGGWIYEKLE